jgi:ribosomal-protein-alanine N-acetyltransferase
VAQTIETARLVLRPPRLADAAAMFEEYAADPAVTRFLTWKPHRSIADTRTFLERQIDVASRGSEASWAITRRDDDRVIGAIDASVEGTAVLLGYVLGRRHWNRGYMSEAVRAVISWGFTLPRIYRVWAVCDVENLASRRVMEKAGMEREGILRRWSLHPNLADEPRDCFVYARVRGASASG